MKILFLSHYSGLYGANQSLLSLMVWLKRNGVDIYVLVPKEGEFTEELGIRGIKFFVLKYYSLWVKKRTFANLIKACAKSVINFFMIYHARKIAKGIDCDIIYTNSSVLGFGYDLAKSINKPHVWHFREFGDLDYGLTYFRGKNCIINKANSLFNITVFISEALREHYKEVKNGKVIYNGVIKSSDIVNIEPNEPNYPFMFSFVGLLHKAKNVLEAIEGFYLADVKNSLLNIYGDSNDEDYKKQIVETIARYELQECVILHGFEKSKDVIFENTDCLIMPSRNEGFGRVTAEAMSRGKIVVGYNGGGTSEIIHNEQNGFLYTGSATELAAIVNKVHFNYDKLSDIRHNAVVTVKEKFTVEKYGENVLNIIEDLA